MLSSGIFPFAKQDTVLVSQKRWKKKEENYVGTLCQITPLEHGLLKMEFEEFHMQ
jgi:hypothetical protein